MASDPEETVKPYARLPRPIRLEDTVTSQDTGPVPDPEGGRDTDHDFLVRYGFGI